MRTLLVATTNAGKLREIRGLLGDLPLRLVALSDLHPIEEPDENGRTFAENAQAKAIHYARESGLLTVAEDSGLEIDAIDRQPGVHSARFPGDTYDEKFQNLFARMDARGARESRARFVCALALAQGEHVIFEALGTVEGQITREPRGQHGFGYDPIFYYPPFNRTLAEVDAATKATVSHRGVAFQRLRTFLERRELPF